MSENDTQEIPEPRHGTNVQVDLSQVAHEHAEEGSPHLSDDVKQLLEDDEDQN